MGSEVPMYQSSCVPTGTSTSLSDQLEHRNFDTLEPLFRFAI